MKPSCPHRKPEDPPHRVTSFGVYYRKRQKTPRQRYRCTDCGKTFSDATATLEYRQKKRSLNRPLFEFLVSGGSLRRAAILLGVNYKTVCRRLAYFEEVCSRENAAFRQNLTGVARLQFDDMETSEHTKLKPLSLPLVVTALERYIVSYDVVSMPAKGLLAAISLKKYGKRRDDRVLGWSAVLKTALSVVAPPGLEILSDSHPRYPAVIRCHLPGAVHRQTISRRACVVGQGELKRGGNDPLFSLNHTAAMFRANVNRLFRRTWCTTKRPDRLKTHMGMYVLWHNEHIHARLHSRSPELPRFQATTA